MILGLWVLCLVGSSISFLISLYVLFKELSFLEISNGRGIFSLNLEVEQRKLFLL